MYCLDTGLSFHCSFNWSQGSTVFTAKKIRGFLDSSCHQDDSRPGDRMLTLSQTGEDNCYLNSIKGNDVSKHKSMQPTPPQAVSRTKASLAVFIKAPQLTSACRVHREGSWRVRGRLNIWRQVTHNSERPALSPLDRTENVRKSSFSAVLRQREGFLSWEWWGQ